MKTYEAYKIGYGGTIITTNPYLALPSYMAKNIATSISDAEAKQILLALCDEYKTTSNLTKKFIEGLCQTRLGDWLRNISRLD